MRYFLLLLLLAGAYFGWTFYQDEFPPRQAEITAMEQAPHPELDEARSRFEELTNQHQQQAARLQAAIQKKEEAVRQFWNARMEEANKAKPAPKRPAPTTGKPAAQNVETRIARLLERYDQRSAAVDALRMKLETTKRQLAAAQSRLEEQIRQVETRLDINRIQRAEADNTKSKEFKVNESRNDLLKLQASLPQELDRINRKGTSLVLEQTEAYEHANRQLILLQGKVDRQIAALRENADSPLVEDDDETAALSTDPQFQAMITPYDQAVLHEETLTTRAETTVETQAKILHGLQQVRDSAIASKQTQLQQDEQFFFIAAIAIGAVLLIASAFSFTRRQA